jgi:hypothetical protein
VNLSHAQTLKQDLIDFVLDSEGELAAALEAHSAEQLSQLTDSPYQGNRKTDLVIESFATNGTVGSQSVLDLFLASRADLSTEDHALVTRWCQGFMGLFAAGERSPNYISFTNWLTAKEYKILLGASPDLNIARLQPQEIVLTRILPIDDAWMLSGPAVFLGKLGKPKLAVAIGNFKKHHREYLYGDAPELLEEAWQSVERHHQAFVDYFGSQEITLPGHKLEQRLSDFQAHMAQQQLAAAGLDGEKSIQALADEAGISQVEIAETAAAIGADQKTAHLLQSQKVSKMMMPRVELPQPLKKAEQVTILTHPRWGQVITAAYQQLIHALAAADETSCSELASLVHQCLNDLEIKPFVWYQLARQYPQPLAKVLQQAIDRPQLNLEALDLILATFGHPAQPQLPETASVPLHLHTLFQDAMLAVSQQKSSRSKGRATPPPKMGFG